MPELPIFFSDAESSLKGVMLFPKHKGKARTFAAWLTIKKLAETRWRALRNPPEFFKFSDLIKFSNDDVCDEFVEAACLAADFSYIYEEMRSNAADGVRAGIIVVCLFALICRETPKAASWESAIEAAEAYFRKHPELPASRSVFKDCLARFGPVLHLLGASMLRRQDQNIGLDRIFDSIVDPSTGYSRQVDTLFFAQEARHLQTTLLLWDSKRKPPSENLRNMFDLTGPWAPPPQKPGWPDTGKIKPVALDPWIEIVRGRPGRPKTKTLS